MNIRRAENRDLQAVLDVHVFGAYALTQAVLPGMIARGHGRIIFISSMSVNRYIRIKDERLYL